jgi:hypothetical protein
MQGLLLADTPAASTPPTEWGVIVLGLLTLIYVAFIRPLKKKKQKDPLEQAPGKSMLAQQRAVERDMSALLVEYEQMMRTMTTQLETRVAKLELLLQEADRTIATLQAERDAAKTTARPAATVPFAPEADKNLLLADAAPKQAAPAPVQRRPAAVPLRTQSEKMDQPAVVTLTQTTAESPLPATLESVGSEAGASREHVYAMADQGLDIGQIARRLGQQYGEVELILALRPQRAEGDDRSLQGIEPFAAAAPQNNEAPTMTATGAVATLPPLQSRPHHQGKHKRRR